jgi:hypothetical protein
MAYVDEQADGPGQYMEPKGHHDRLLVISRETTSQNELLSRLIEGVTYPVGVAVRHGWLPKKIHDYVSVYASDVKLPLIP